MNEQTPGDLAGAQSWETHNRPEKGISLSYFRPDGDFHIGCSGYYYSFWRNRFYPPDVPPAEWLAYYSLIYDTVELNGTFYKTPRITTLQKYAEQTPDDFTFAVKMSKYITHILRLKDARQSVADFQKLISEGLEKKLACFLFQLPPSFHYNHENMMRVLESIPEGISNVVEFRHSSWWNDDVKRLFIDHNLTFCNVDFPGLQTHFISTSPNFYFRFHGNPDLFKSSYADLELKNFLNQLPPDCREYRIYFNNTYFEAGFTNASTMQALANGGGYDFFKE